MNTKKQCATCISWNCTHIEDQVRLLGSCSIMRAFGVDLVTQGDNAYCYAEALDLGKYVYGRSQAILEVQLANIKA